MNPPNKRKKKYFLPLNIKRKTHILWVFQRHYANQALKVIFLCHRQYHRRRKQLKLCPQILHCLCYAACVQDNPDSASQQLMTLAYSRDFLLIIVALSKINNTVQQDFNWTGCNTELEEILKGSRIHDSKWKQAEEDRSSCTMSLHSNNKNLLYNNTTDLSYGKPLSHYLFSSLCLFSLKKPCLSPLHLLPLIQHLSCLSLGFHLQIHSSICRCALHISDCVHYRK